MLDDRTKALATAIVIAVGVLWGVYWVPVRALTSAGLGGAWGTLAITAAAACFLAPLVILRRRQVFSAPRLAIAAIALGGAAFALYSIAFVYGRVAIIVLLFFLTPVWSTLIGRFVMGWHTPRMRLLAIGVGLLGLGVMLSANGTVPLPRNLGEWMGLASGLLWSFSTTGIRAKSNIPPIEASFIFVLGACVTSLILAPLLEPLPTIIGFSFGHLALIALASGCVWWGISMASLMWATLRLEPARVGILLMSEVLVGAATAAYFAAEHLSAVELIGGALVLCAGILELWPEKKSRVRE